MRLVPRDTPRDQEILTLLLEGAENGEIARRLGIGNRTVKFHMGAMYARRQITKGIKRVHLAVQTVDRPKELVATAAVLTPREKEMVRLVTLGKKNREIAEKLGITHESVKNYMRLVYNKLGLWNRVEVALWYMAHEGEIQ